MKKIYTVIIAIMLIALAACSGNPGAVAETNSVSAEDTNAPVTGSETTSATAEITDNAGAKPTLMLIGHASFKIKTSEGKVVYVDPYSEGDYSESADMILVSHGHSDHNKISLCTQKEGCVVLTQEENINGDGSFHTYASDWITVEPVPAYNMNHPKGTGSGFVITLDGISLYIAGDTSKIGEMAALTAKSIDYAFFPIDGEFNMGPAEAMECAVTVGAKHNTPIHFFDADPEDFKPENLLRIAYGETIELTH